MALQRSLFTKAKQPISHRLRAYEQANLEAAKVILASPDKYDGLPKMWAETIVRKAERVPAQERKDDDKLF